MSTENTNIETPLLHLSSSPHTRSALTVQKIMLMVIIAMVPSFIASAVFFGARAVLLVAVSIATAVITELFANMIMKRPRTVGDLSAVITGMLVAFNVPPELPLWMAALGSVFAIGVGKMVFGGLGCNFINPALAGRAFLFASYPAEMTTFPPTSMGGMSGINVTAAPAVGVSTAESVTEAVTSATNALGASAVDAITSATPLGAIKYAFNNGIYNAQEFVGALKPLFFGNVGGCIGETSALALLLGGIFLICIRAIDFRIPLAYILTMFALFWAANGTGEYFTLNSIVAPTFHILGGGLFLGAFFMATDPVTSPITPKGRILFGIGCGALTFVIRKYGGYPEGVSFSILLMNLVAPLIERYTRPTIYGEVKKSA